VLSISFIANWGSLSQRHTRGFPKRQNNTRSDVSVIVFVVAVPRGYALVLLLKQPAATGMYYLLLLVRLKCKRNADGHLFKLAKLSTISNKSSASCDGSDPVQHLTDLFMSGVTRNSTVSISIVPDDESFLLDIMDVTASSSAFIFISCECTVSNSSLALFALSDTVIVSTMINNLSSINKLIRIRGRYYN